MMLQFAVDRGGGVDVVISMQTVLPMQHDM